MLQFIYTGETAIESSKLVEFLALSHQYMIGSLKQSLEQLLGQNLSPETFIDTFMVAKTFECQ